MKYKVGDRVWWYGLKGVVLSQEELFFGKKILYTTDIVFKPAEENPTVKTFESSLKPIITLKAELA